MRTKKQNAQKPVKCLQPSHQGNADENCAGLCLTPVKTTTKERKLHDHWRECGEMRHFANWGWECRWAQTVGTHF